MGNMAKENGGFQETIDSLLQRMNGYLSTKTVVGEPITVKDTVIVPLADVQFGIGAGAFAKPDRTNGAGGVTGKMSPSAVLVIQNGNARVINIKNQDSVSRLLDMVPDIVNKFTAKNEETDPDVDQAVADVRAAGPTAL